MEVVGIRLKVIRNQQSLFCMAGTVEIIGLVVLSNHVWPMNYRFFITIQQVVLRVPYGELMVMQFDVQRNKDVTDVLCFRGGLSKKVLVKRVCGRYPCSEGVPTTSIIY